MKRQHYFPLNLATAACLLLLTVSVAVVNATETTDSVEDRYLSRMDRVERELRTANVHRTALEKRLELITQRIENVHAQETKTSEQEPTLSTTLNELQQDIVALGNLLKVQHQSLAVNRQLLTSHPKPSVLADALGQADALTLHRTIAVTRYMVHRSSASVKETIGRREALLNKKTELLRANAGIQKYLKGLTDNREELLHSRLSLESEFSELSGQIVNKQDELELFKKRLEEIKVNPNALTFTHYQGALPDPTNGRVLNRYAEPKARGLLKWEGILITAPLDQSIKSVFDGVVVFADRIQGLGNVAIIDHGDGYMSLYGTADFLIVEPGQHVLTGDILGVVGESVGIDGSTLYFEVRHNAVTLDPQEWLAMEKISSKD